jgi:iron complex transport system permease protein
MTYAGPEVDLSLNENYGAIMKITLDLDRLLKDGKITQAEYERFAGLAVKSTGSLAFNILIGFGVIAVSGAALALIPAPTTAILIGLCILISGLVLLRGGLKEWTVLANICILVGALMAGGGIFVTTEGSLGSILSVAAVFAVASIFAKSALLAVLSTLMLSAAIGARTGYFHASYFLVIQEPAITVILFSVLAIGLYQLSKVLASDYERIAIASARTSVFLVNFGFWVGSLWGERGAAKRIVISDEIFSVLWAIALVATAVWAWKRNRRWVLNTVATFGGIHFYTQWFENLGASPGTVLLAGLLALGFAVALRASNFKMKASSTQT